MPDATCSVGVFVFAKLKGGESSTEPNDTCKWNVAVVTHAEDFCFR